MAALNTDLNQYYVQFYLTHNFLSSAATTGFASACKRGERHNEMRKHYRYINFAKKLQLSLPNITQACSQHYEVGSFFFGKVDLLAHYGCIKH